MRDLACDPPDGNHAARAGLPGFRDVVCVRRDLTAGPPMKGHGMICEACRSVLEASGVLAEENERTLRLQALNKWRTNAGLTILEARRVISSFGKDEL